MATYTLHRYDRSGVALGEPDTLIGNVPRELADTIMAHGGEAMVLRDDASIVAVIRMPRLEAIGRDALHSELTDVLSTDLQHAAS